MKTEQSSRIDNVQLNAFKSRSRNHKEFFLMYIHFEHAFQSLFLSNQQTIYCKVRLLRILVKRRHVCLQLSQKHAPLLFALISSAQLRNQCCVCNQGSQQICGRICVKWWLHGIASHWHFKKWLLKLQLKTIQNWSSQPLLLILPDPPRLSKMFLQDIDMFPKRDFSSRFVPPILWKHHSLSIQDTLHWKPNLQLLWKLLRSTCNI